jgi:hypothetical protein
MTICLRPRDPQTSEGLALFLSRHDCPAKAAEDGTVLVVLPHFFHREQARMEVALYIRLWEALHGTSVRIEMADSSLLRTAPAQPSKRETAHG